MAVRLGEVVAWLDSTFKTLTSPYPEDATLKVKIRFTIEILRLAHDMTSLQYASNELFEILGGMMLLMKEFKDLSVDPHSLHWCGGLKLLISKREKTNPDAKISEINDLIQECLENLKIACRIRTNRQVSTFLQHFHSLHSGDLADLSESFVQQVFKNQDFARKRVDLDATMTQIVLSTSVVDGRIPSLKQVAPEERSRQMEEMSVDIFLLKQLFRSNIKAHERTALEILISNFDQRSRIRQYLEGAELLVEDVFREKYKKLKTLYNRLRILLQDIQQLSDIKLFKEGSIDDDLDQLSDVFNIICAEIRNVLDLNEREEIRSRSQRIARNVGIHKLLFEFLGTNFYWVEKGNPMALSLKGRQKTTEFLMVIKEEKVFELYRNAAATLYSFCFANWENQLLAYDKISLLLRLMDNKIGLSRLLGQAIVSQRSTENAGFLIKYVFLDLLAHSTDFTSRPHDIKMLNYLIHENDGSYFTNNQTQIFQEIIRYEPFREKYHKGADTTELYFAEFHSEDSAEIKFFAVLLTVVVKCSIQNRYVSAEARKMFPLPCILSKLQDPNFSLKLRKVLYQYFFFVFCMETFDGLKREVEIDKLADFIDTVLLKDLSFLEDFLQYVPVLSKKGEFWPVPCKKMEKQFLRTTSAQLQGGSLRAVLFGGPETGHMIGIGDDLDEQELRARKYLKQVLDFKPWKPKHSTGYLSIFIDILSELKAHNVDCSRILTQMERMKDRLSLFVVKLNEMQQFHPDIDVSHMVSKLDSALRLFPQEYMFLDEENDALIEREAVKRLAETIARYIENNGLMFETFVLSLSSTEVVPKAELIETLRSRFPGETTYHQLEIVMSAVSRTDAEVFLIDFSRTLEPYLRAMDLNPNPTLQHVPSNPISSINEELRYFLKTKYSDLTKEKEMEELQELVARIEATVVIPALEKGDLKEISRLNTNLEKAFRDPKHKVYLLRIYQFLMQRIQAPGNQAEKLKPSLKLVQESNITEMATGLIYLGNNPGIIEEAFTLLNTLLEHNPRVVRAKLLETLKTTIDHFMFFSFIRSNIRKCLERIETLAEDKTPEPSKKTNYRPSKAGERLSEAEGVNKIDSSELTRKVLKFLELCSDSCDKGFQTYFRTQGNESRTVSINLVNELSVFLINIQKNEDLFQKFKSTETSLTAHYALGILINLCCGPSKENQMIVGTRRQVYDFVNLVIAVEIDFTETKSFFIDIFELTVELLIALLEGSPASEISRLMLKKVNLQRLVYQATRIYEQLIAGREALIHQYQENAKEHMPCLRWAERPGKPVSENEMRIIESGFQINILIMTLHTLHPNMRVISVFFSEGEKSHAGMANAEEVMRRMEANDEEVEIGRRLMFQAASVARWVKTALGIPVTRLTPKILAYQFYFSNIASVEIDHNGKLVRQLFHIPSMCTFLSRRSQEAVVTKVKRTSHQEKIDDFFSRSAQYELEMIHRQQLARFPALHKACKMWEIYASVSFWLVLAINLELLFAIRHTDDDLTGSWTWETDIKSSVQALGFTELVLSAMVLIGHLIEYYPVIVYKRSEKKRLASHEQFNKKEWISIKGTSLIHDIIARTKVKVDLLLSHPPLTFEIIAILRDSSVVYHALYFAISLIAWVKFLWYPILLLDVVKRREDLVNVLKSITLNSKSLILTLVMGIITIYLFTIVGLIVIPGYYLNEDSDPGFGDMNVAALYCDSLLNCFVSTLVQGIRAGGGVGDNLLSASYGEDHYWPVFFFSMLYFVLVVIVLLNIIFGIIIDTFAELRDERKDMLHDIEHKCFICGLDKFQFEVWRLPWKNHTNMDHNVYAYLAYIIYIKHKPEVDCSGIELYVRERIKEKDVAFFPKHSMALQEKMTKDEEENEQEATEIKGLVEELRAKIQGESTLDRTSS